VRGRRRMAMGVLLGEGEGAGVEMDRRLWSAVDTNLGDWLVCPK
jgi:hypothetical protein